MKLHENFPCTDDDGVTTIDAVFYLTEQDMRELIDAIQMSLTTPRMRFSPSMQGVQRKLQQFQQALKKLKGSIHDSNSSSN